MQVAVLLVSNGRDRISADGGQVDRAVTFLVDLADEDAGKRQGESMVSTWRDISVVKRTEAYDDNNCKMMRRAADGRGGDRAEKNAQRATHIMSPLTRYSPRGTSSTPSSML